MLDPVIARALKDLPKGEPRFVEPMQCKLVSTLPQVGQWSYEIKFDGYRALAIKTGKIVKLISRNNNDLSARYPGLIQSLQQLTPGDAVLDGEIVALDEKGRPSFQALQNAGTSTENRIYYYAFDLLNVQGADTTELPLLQRRQFLQSSIKPDLPRIRFSESITGEDEALLAEVMKLGLEGIVGKRADSKYEVGRRSGAWIKYKCLNEQEFVIGGYTHTEGIGNIFGALVVGYYEQGQLRFASKVGTGFTFRVMTGLMKKFMEFVQPNCPFVDLPQKTKGRWGQGLTRADMQRCVWLRPELVCRVRFTEWTHDGGLRHPSFKGLREDKDPREVERE